jgi:capsular polysaccharide transport system permease protein
MQTNAVELARRLRRERARRLGSSVALWVGVPTLLASIYYGFIAAKEYESFASVMLRGESDRGALLEEYSVSRDMLHKLEKSQRWGAHYKEYGDFLSRLSSSAGSESRYDFFRRHVTADFDTRTNIFRLKLRAFTGKDAQRFTRAALEHGQAFLKATQAGEAQTIIPIAQPSAPTEATYPRRVYSILTVFLVSLAAYAIGSLLIAAAREHAQF